MPARRPRSESGIDWFHIVVRQSPLTMSAPPATTSPAIAKGSDLAKPNPMIPSPMSPRTSATMRPWRRTRRAHPLVRVTSNEPADGAAYRTPSTAAPPRWLATWGNSAVGIPKNMAFMSIEIRTDQVLAAPRVAKARRRSPGAKALRTQAAGARHASGQEPRATRRRSRRRPRR